MVLRLKNPKKAHRDVADAQRRNAEVHARSKAAQKAKDQKSSSKSVPKFTSFANKQSVAPSRSTTPQSVGSVHAASSVESAAMAEGRKAEKPTFWNALKKGFTGEAALKGMNPSNTAEQIGFSIGTAAGLMPFMMTEGGVSGGKALTKGVEDLSGGIGKITDWTKYGNNPVRVELNSKTVGLTAEILKKKFSKKALLWAGSWAGAIFLGKWGQAESSEPLSVVMTKYLVPEAIKTGDWSFVDEAQAARSEILDLSWWEKVGLWSPVSPFIGIPKKIKGAIASAKVQDKFIADLKVQQETGETTDEKWARVREEQASQERAAVDYYNSERKKLLAWEEEAKNNDMKADAAFWAREAAKQRLLEEKDRRAIADFWLAYKKESQRLADDNRPSKLNFGLL